MNARYCWAITHGDTAANFTLIECVFDERKHSMGSLMDGTPTQSKD